MCTLVYLGRRRNSLREVPHLLSLYFYCLVLAAGRSDISYNNIAKSATSETRGLLKARFGVISVWAGSFFLLLVCNFLSLISGPNLMIYINFCLGWVRGFWAKTYSISSNILTLKLPSTHSRWSHRIPDLWVLRERQIQTFWWLVTLISHSVLDSTRLSWELFKNTCACAPEIVI